ncbi:MAG: M23 family metallopeptidase [Candidatus Riflebacteria bacterium]|nr:M23 family metallopeptidase [Candidatus Riflebacteria bacterium]
MVNKSSTEKSLLMLLLLCTAIFQPGISNASAHFVSVKSVGLLTDQVYLEKTPHETPAERTSFFGTLGPGSSNRGAVKTYTVKVVKRHTDKGFAGSKIANADRSVNKILLRPVSGRVSSLFGRRKHPTSKSWHFHTGIDIVARKGTPVVSSLSGKVSYAGWRRGYGLIIVVDHGNDLQTAYAHCSRLAVKVGQSVNAGQRIGYVGSTGVTTGSHLHFEVRRNGAVQNPFRFLAL